MKSKKVVGFVTSTGGRTGHTAIMARSMGIAAVIGCPDALCGIQPGDAVIVDGKKGLAITNPSETIVREYKEKLFDQKLRQDLSDMNKFKRLRALLRASVFGNLRVMDAIGRVKSLLLLRNDIYEA